MRQDEWRLLFHYAMGLELVLGDAVVMEQGIVGEVALHKVRSSRIKL